MLRHTVYFWLDETLSPEDRAAFEEGMRALFEIPAVSAGTFGKAGATPVRPVTQNTFDYCLALEFASVAEHDAYQIDPGHDVFVERFSPWFREVRVYDVEFS
jgi:hypothetical protein